MTGVVQYVALLPFAVVAAGTDAWRHRVHNWNTYPGMAVGVVVNLVVGGLGLMAAGAVLDPAAETEAWSWAAAGSGTVHGLLGFLGCGFVMLFCFVFFPIGGGDVKLVAMYGAFLGIDHGVEVLLWTFVLGAVMSIAVLIWRIGAVELVRRTVGQAWVAIRTGGKVPMSEEEREPLQQELFLAVAGLCGIVAVMFRRGIVKW